MAILLGESVIGKKGGRKRAGADYHLNGRQIQKKTQKKGGRGPHPKLVRGAI